MDTNLADLQKLDREGLLAVLVAQHHQLLETQQRLASRESEVAHLKLLIVKLQRMQFGRRSEKVQRQIEQLELRLEELEANKTAESTSPESRAVAPTFGTKPRRGPLPDHLPREVRRREPKETVCPGCGGELRKIGEDVSEMLEYVPEKFKVIRQVRPKLSCAACERIVQAAAETRPIEHGMAGPGLLAHVLDLEVRRSPAAVSAVGDLRAARSGSGTVDASRLGRSNERTDGAVGRSSATLRVRLR
jgi:transposase